MPHDPPEELFPDVLFVHGSGRMFPGMIVNRNMVALRHNGELTLLNPVRLSPDGEKAVEGYGRVRHAVRLGYFHGIDDAYTVDSFGGALLVPAWL